MDSPAKNVQEQRSPPHRPRLFPANRLQMLSHDLRKDGTMDVIAHGLQSIDLNCGRRHDLISDLRLFYRGSTTAPDYDAVIADLQRKILERNAQVEHLEAKMAILKKQVAALSNP